MRRRRHPRRGAAAPAGVWLGVCLLPRLFAGRLPAAAFVCWAFVWPRAVRPCAAQTRRSGPLVQTTQPQRPPSGI